MGNENRLFKNYLIYPSFQWRLISFIMLICMITPISLYIFQFMAFQDLLAEGKNVNLPDTHPYFVFMLKYQSSLYKILLYSFAASFALAFIFGILVTHKVAGPLVKMRNCFNEIADKAQPDQEITFRKGDFFHDLAEAYNKRFKK